MQPLVLYRKGDLDPDPILEKDVYAPTTIWRKQQTSHNMAIARPIRVLALAAIGLWIFFAYQVFGPAKVPKAPGEKVENMERDPNLDRMRAPFLFGSSANPE